MPTWRQFWTSRGACARCRRPNPLQFAAFGLQLLLTAKGQPNLVQLSERSAPAMTDQLGALADWPFEPAEGGGAEARKRTSPTRSMAAH